MKAIQITGILMLLVCSTATAAGRLDINLQSIKTAKSGASVVVRLSNTGDHAIERPSSYIPDVGEDGLLQNNLFEVTQEDGSPVDYRGIYVRNVRGSNGSVMLSPGQSVVRTIDLSLC